MSCHHHCHLSKGHWVAVGYDLDSLCFVQEGVYDFDFYDPIYDYDDDYDRS